MSKEHSDRPYIPAREECTYLPPHLRPKVQSTITPKVYSRIQPKLLTDLYNKKPEINTNASLEQEADSLGKRASEGKEATVTLSSGTTLQRKEEDQPRIDHGVSDHAKGEFDPIANAYLVPDASKYENPEKAYDTLYSIARRFGVSTEAIKQANHLSSDGVTAGQHLIIPSPGTVKQETKPAIVHKEVKSVAPQENKIPVKGTVAETKNEAAELISKHTSFLMLDEDGLAKELVEKYILSRPDILSSVLNRIEDYNRDDLAVSILKLIPLSKWKDLDKKLLKEFSQHLGSGIVSDEEESFLLSISEFLNPKEKSAIEKEKITPKIKAEEPKIAKDTSVSIASNIAIEDEPYASQMDNTFSKFGIYGDTGPKKLVTNYNTCNVTALAMALRRVEDDNKLKNSVINILIENGGYNKTQHDDLFKKDLEDLIMMRFEQAGSDYFLEPLREYSAIPSFTFPTGPNSVAPHQFAFCLDYIGKDILEGNAIIKDLSAKTKEGYSKIKPYFNDGFGAFLGTKLTESGHVVSLDSIHEDGITINDPYGLFGTKQNEYIVNGSKLNSISRQIIIDNPKNLSKKLTFAKETYDLLVKSSESDEKEIVLPHTLGKKNFYSWTQVQKYEIGWWISLINKR